MPRPRLLALTLALLVSPAGCDQEEDPGIESFDFAKEERSARCDYLVRCGFAPDRDSCIGAFEIDRGYIQAIGGIALERVEYNPQAALAYVDLLEEIGCEETIENGRLIEEAQAAAVIGLIEDGDACFADQECAGERSICDQTGCPNNQACCTGVCTEVRELGLGSECPLQPEGDRITAFCEDTAYCAPPATEDGAEPPTTGTCQPRVDASEACERNEQCLDGQRCAMGQCFTLSPSGETCNPTLQSGSCIDVNQVCDMGSSTCVDAPGDGQACVFGRCQPYAQCVEDVCVRRPGLGESCENTPPCQGNLQCRDNVCVDDPVVFVCVEGEPPPPPEPE
ncbi:MAG: EB domain-containing protein [Myxococcota bacterium]